MGLSRFRIKVERRVFTCRQNRAVGTEIVHSHMTAPRQSWPMLTSIYFAEMTVSVKFRPRLFQGLSMKLLELGYTYGSLGNRLSACK